MLDLIDHAARLLLVLTPTKRVYLPYLLGGAALASLVWLRHCRRRCSLLAFLFPRGIWLHPSTLLDLRIAAFRTLLEGVLVAPFAIPVTAVALGIARLGWHHVGIVPTVLDLGRGTVCLAFSLAAFCAEDLGRYIVHRLAHEVPALWELHKVHHSAEVMTPLTAYRTHPLESVLMRTGGAGSLALVAGFFVWCFPGKVSALEIGGMYALSYVWNVLGSNLRHSHVWLSYPRWLERLLLSPAQHQLHHSTDPALHHANYGTALAVWDRLGGSLRLAGRRRRLEFGVPPDQANHARTVRSVLWHPLAAAVRALRVRGWSAPGRLRARTG